MQIPERLTNFRAYSGLDSQEYLGLSTVELPAFEAMTETISGAGIAGEYASPTPGHFGSQMAKFSWRTPTEKMLLLMAPVQQTIVAYGAMQLQDPMLGALVSKQLRVEVRGQVKHHSLGKLEPGKIMAAEVDIECAVIRVDIDGKRVIELDKFNMIFRVNGVDYLAETRRAMGGV